MTRCARCTALDARRHEEGAGAHLRESPCEPDPLRLAQPGVRHHDMTSISMFRCPDDACGDRWWRACGDDGSFVEWHPED